MGRHHFFNQLKDMEGCKGTIRIGIAKGEKVYKDVKICSVLLSRPNRILNVHRT